MKQKLRILVCHWHGKIRQRHTEAPLTTGTIMDLCADVLRHGIPDEITFVDRPDEPESIADDPAIVSVEEETPV